MRWEDIDSVWWTIPPDFTKNGLAHRVPLSEPAVEILEELRVTARKSEWVLPSPTGNGPLRSVWRAMNSIRKNTGVEFVPHDLRRTGASRMTGNLGITRLVVSKVLNHVETGITATYDRHSYDREKRQALDTWGARLLEILSGKEQAANVVQIPLRSEPG